MTRRVKCATRGCYDKAACRGFCMKHYLAWYRSGSFEKKPPPVLESSKPCAQCGKAARENKRPLCRECANALHREQYRARVGFKPCKTAGCNGNAAHYGLCRLCHLAKQPAKCRTPDCEGDVFCRGMCSRCYAAKRRAENPMPGCKPPRSRHEYSVRGRCLHCGFERMR